jgi:hypothetical protein
LFWLAEMTQRVNTGEDEVLWIPAPYGLSKPSSYSSNSGAPERLAVMIHRSKRGEAPSVILMPPPPPSARVPLPLPRVMMKPSTSVSCGTMSLSLAVTT